MLLKNSLITITLAICFSLKMEAQVVQSAHLSEDGIYSVQEHRNFPLKASSRLPFEQLNNFPFGTLAHPAFKNVRNVSQADITGDGQSEIIFCANETLYALNGNGDVVWSFEMEGTSNFPPAIADINKDNEVDIACQTYGVQPNVGNVYLFDKGGNLYPNFPFNSDNNFFLNGVVIAREQGAGNGDHFLVASERVSSTEGRIHLIKSDGESLNDNYPVTIGGTPAVTPTITLDQEQSYLVLCSTTAMYLTNFEGEFINSSPFVADNSKFSYQSPLAGNIQEGPERFIIGAMHGDNPKDYVINENGIAHGSWPHLDDIWTYAPPSLWENDLSGGSGGHMEVFFNRPYVNEDVEGPILLGYDANGNPLPNFPIMGNAGSEGLVTIGDIDGDGDQELISPSKIMVNGKGMINAYHLESGELVDGFPLMVPGFTFMNGAYLGDVNGDGKLDLTALSYQLKFDPNSPDSTYINVFDMEIPYEEFGIKFNGYKGHTNHAGYFFNPFLGTSVLPTFPISISPNPSISQIRIEAESDFVDLPYQILNIQGQIVQNGIMTSELLDITSFPAGKYQLRILAEDKQYINTFVKVD